MTKSGAEGASVSFLTSYFHKVLEHSALPPFASAQVEFAKTNLLKRSRYGEACFPSPNAEKITFLEGKP